MVQGKASDIKIESDDAKKTTLTIAQDFPKNKADKLGGHHNVEMVQGKSTDIKIDEEGKKTTLTIVQDFPKKKDETSGHQELI